VRGRLGTFLVLGGLGALAAGVFPRVFAAAQRRLLYFPVREDLARAAEAARRAGFSPWSIDGRFLGWRAAREGPPPRAVLLVLHGNAGSALDRRYFRDVFQATGPVDVILLEYPGYGPRGGDPSQRSLVEACLEAVDLLSRQHLPVAIVGESLGSAVAALAAAERPARVASLLLVTPLASVTAVAKRHYPFLPSAVIADAYRADLALPRYPGPVAFLVAGRDEVVFSDLGLALFGSRTGPKRLWIEPRSGHNDLEYDPRHPKWREMLHFLLPDAAP
jgi:pimeloyl-ACP methyl ester carboxylesterase